MVIYKGTLVWTRQGRPLSPSAEIIRVDPRIQGVSAHGVTYNISLYADYVILYITVPLNSIPVLLSCLGEFGEISGYKQNKIRGNNASGQVANRVRQRSYI